MSKIYFKTLNSKNKSKPSIFESFSCFSLNSILSYKDEREKIGCVLILKERERCPDDFLICGKRETSKYHEDSLLLEKLYRHFIFVQSVLLSFFKIISELFIYL